MKSYPVLFSKILKTTDMKKMFLPMVLSILLLAACNNEKKTDEGVKEEKTVDNAEEKDQFL